MKIPSEIIQFFEKQGGIIVSTLDEAGRIHCSVKGIVGFGSEGKLLLIDLYLLKTFGNLKNNPIISLTAVDEHLFKGYTLQGRAKIIERKDMKPHQLEEWDKRVSERITRRVMKSVKTGARAHRHHEAHLPSHPKYLIEVDIESVIDLRPPSGKSGDSTHG